MGIVSLSSPCEGGVSAKLNLIDEAPGETGQEQRMMCGRWMLTGMLGAGHGVIEVHIANSAAN